MQKIDNIEIKNFKSIRDAKINDCSRVNIFIGYPNVGKSNILEAIGLLT
ncbi:MAG: AAA family ATPase, partial [Ferruginibacter sp.]